MVNSKCIIVVRLMLRPTGPAIPHAPTAVVSGDAAPDLHRVDEFRKRKVETFTGVPTLVPSEPPFDGVRPTLPAQLRARQPGLALISTSSNKSHGTDPSEERFSRYRTCSSRLKIRK